MQYATCNRCHGPLDPGYRFCKTCGLDLANPFAHVQVQQNADPLSEDKQAIKTLLLVLVIRYGAIVLNSALMYAMRWIGMGYRYVSYFSDFLLVGYIVVLLIFGIKTKHKMVRTVIWIIFAVEAILFLRGLFFYRMPFAEFQF